MPLTGQKLEHLRWHCVRRGLLELDLTLGKFLDERYSTLSDAQADAFEGLIRLEDPELWALVSGREASADPAQAEILAMLIKH